MGRRTLVLSWLGVLAVAVALRAPDLVAARPYINYVDEGNFLHPVAAMLRTGGWDQRWYLYPSLPGTVVAAATRAVAPLYRATHDGESLRSRLPVGEDRYDVLEPFAFLLTARAMSLAASLGVVVLTGLFGARLLAPGWGVLAALLAAVAPPLVIRGALASVDPYATLATLASLYLTHRSRDAAAPGRYALAAGAAAGCAFAAKYPAALVLVAFAATTLLVRPGWREALRRLLLAGAGFVLGAIAAMPAIVRHPGEVAAAIVEQGRRYAAYTSPPLWRQALQRAEWDIAYDRPELGAVWLAAMAVGLALALRHRRLRATAGGWLAYAVASLGFLLMQSFQPFRNLLPLVPLGCLALVVLLAWLRERVRRPAWAVLAVALVGLAALPVAAHARQRWRTADSRTQAVDWLASHAAADQATVVLRELAFLPRELERIPGAVAERRWPPAAAAARSRRPRWIMTGVLGQAAGPEIDTATSPAITRRYELRARFGSQPTPYFDWWRGNQQIVYVFERRAGRPRAGAAGPATARQGPPPTRPRRRIPSGARERRRRRRRAPP
jgi:4-amino-4-deoxy-L-arabinose transferase-like glycosyltransferase